MSLSGRLEEILLAHVLQFLHLSGLTGTLTLSSGSGQARIGWYAGNIISAHCPVSKRLGTYLVQLGAIDQQTLDRALEAQKAEQPPPPVGALLLRMAALPRADLVQAFQLQVEETIAEVVSWQRGAFSFELDDLEPLDDIALSPNELGVVNLHAQQSLREAVRVVDPRKRSASGHERGVSPASKGLLGTDMPRIRLLSSDAALARALAVELASEQVRIEPSTRSDALGDAAEPCPVLVDARERSEVLDSLGALHAASPDRVLLAIVPPLGTMVEIYDAGATAAVDAEPAAIVACLRSVSAQRRSAARRQFADGLAAGFAKLRRLVHAVRARALSAAAPLDLLQLVSDAVERGVFLLVHPSELVCLGAFGVGPQGQPLAERVRGLRLERGSAGALEQCARDGQSRSCTLAEAKLPAELVERIGRPASERCALFPSAGSGRTIAVIYADNGDRDWPIEEVEFLELAAAQLGLAFENEQLRHRASTAEP